MRVRAEFVSAGDQLNALGLSDEKTHDLQSRAPWIIVTISNVGPEISLPIVKIPAEKEELTQPHTENVFRLSQCEKIVTPPKNTH